MCKIVYIYGLREEGSEEFRYIGKTIMNPKKRLKNHKDYASQNPSTHCGCWIKSLRDSGKKIEMEILATCSEDNWEEVEISYIALFKSFGARLTNHSRGGKEQPKWNTYSKEKQKVIRDNFESKRKAPPSRKGCKMPESAKLITLKNLKRNDRKIKQLTLEGVFIKTWNSIIEAARHLNTGASNISRAAKYKERSSGGFKWEYID